MLKLRRAPLGLLGAAAVLVPLVPLFRLGRVWEKDWTNHVWTVAYYAAHWGFPTTIDTHRAVGMAQPLFYGYLFYPPLALLSLFTGADLAVRLGAAGVFALQYFLVYRAARWYGATHWLALGIASFVAWEIYPLTCLYNRGALPEFFAVCLLHGAVATWLASRPFAALLLLTWAAGIHPITGLFGAIAFLIIAGASLFVHPMTPLEKKRAGAGAGLFLIVLAPWLYATLLYAGKLKIFDGIYHGLEYYPELDTFASRFYPLAWAPPVSEIVSTRGMDTQLDVALLLWTIAAVAALLWAGGRWAARTGRLFVVGALFFTLFALWSIEWGAVVAPLGLLRHAQFAYRLVTYANLFLLVAAIATVRNKPPIPIALTVALLFLSFTGMAVKLDHASRAELRIPKLTPTELPSTFYGELDYTARKGAKLPATALAHQANLPVTGSLEIVTGAPGWVLTNAHAFGGNVLFVDDKPAVITATREGRIAAWVTRGTHRLKLHASPPFGWRLLRVLSYMALVSWTGFVVASWRRPV